MSCETKALVLRNVCKTYRIYAKSWQKLLGLFCGVARNRAREFHALSGINLEVNKGECVGIVGRNGAGKSTLLQLITGTARPTSGHIQVNGRLAALLELGSGFNPEFTGHQNILINAAVLGMSEAEIRSRYQDIVAFAGIGEFLHRPVKTYSSGMAMRLAFAVQIMINPDILIIDEVLAVGDAAFQLKCLDRMRELLRGGTTILFVSHDIGVVQNFCHKVYWLDEGRMRMSGPADEVLNRYIMHLYKGLEYRKSETAEAQPHSGALDRIRNFETAGQGGIELLEAGLLDAEGKTRRHAVLPEEPVCFAVNFCAHVKVSHPHIFVCLQDRNGQRIVTISSLLENVRLQDVALEKVYQCRFTFIFPQLFYGNYSFSVSAVDGNIIDFSILHMVTGISPITVQNISDKNTMALFYLNNIKSSLMELQND